VPATSVTALLQEAVRLHRQGRLGEAERLCRTALQHDARNFDGLYLLGLLLMQQRRADEAIAPASAALKRNPASADALMLLGSIMLMQTRADEAVSLFDRAVVAQPKSIDARYNRAVALGQVGRSAQALAGYDQVLAAQPDFAPAWFNRGAVLVQLGRYEEAVDSFDHMLALTPDNPDALNNRGNTLALLGRHEAALETFERLLKLQPGHLDGLSNRATALSALGRREEALTSAECALAIRPDHVTALVTRGNVLHALERFDEALASYDRALARSPTDPKILINRGISLLELGRFEEALANAERAVAIEPSSAATYAGRGKAYQALARHQEGIADYERALAIDPAMPDAQLNLAMCFLAVGRFGEGWARYQPQHRPNWHRFGSRPINARPVWDGRPVPGTVLIWCDEGLGDQILHAGALAELSRQAGRAMVEVDPRLVPLFARSFPDIGIVPGFEADRIAGEVDAQNVASSLARFFRPSFESIPRRDRGYLMPEPRRAQKLRERLAGDGRRVIGLSWISKNADIGRFKGTRLKDFEPVLRLPGCRFIDLQYGDTAVERETVERELGVRVERLADIDNMNDLDGLAALVSACDAVLTVSNTTAHLAGAVGAKTFVMVAFGRGRLWYWFPERPTSPWYPRLQVRGLAKGQTWAGLIAGLAPDIAAAIQS
jgi:tetratricopeptide (TPR) repeat protein